MKKSIILLFLCSLCIYLCANDSGQCGRNLNWSFDSQTGSLTITGSGAMYDFPYTKTPWYTYARTGKIKSISLPQGLTYIGEYAFMLCSFTSLNIPNGVTGIGESALYGCSELSHLVIPSTALNLGDGVFYGCDKLVTAGPIGSGCNYEYGWENMIPSNAFDRCDELSSLIISDAIMIIEKEAMGYLDGGGIYTLFIPNTVQWIGENALRGVFNVQYNGAASGAPWGAKCVNAYVKDNFIYRDSTKTTLLRCNSAVEGIVSIPNSVISIEDGAFEWCKKITKIIIPNSVTSIGPAAFSGCYSLTLVNIPNSVTTIGNGAFRGCSSLTSVTIPNSVTIIGVDAFDGCSGLTSVTIPNSVTTINMHAFSHCSGLTSITIPNSVTTIGGSAFSGCSGLTSVTIGNSVTTIESWAFSYCSGLTSVTIPNSVTTIGNNAFSGCSGLTSVRCFAVNPPSCDLSAFDGINQDAKVYVLASSLSAYQSADVWKDLNLFPLGADETPIEGDEPIVTPSDQDVTITWPITDGTDTYTLTITKNGEVVCVLTFNANGQLTNIAFKAPAANGSSQAPAATLTAQGYQFTVTGLNSGTAYDYSVTATDTGGKTLAEHKGNFSTTGGTGLESVHDAQPTMHKVFRNGQLLIETNNATYTPLGQKVK